MAYSKQYQNRGNKYKAIKQKFNGRTYHSKKEAAYAAQAAEKVRVAEEEAAKMRAAEASAR